MPKAKSQQPKKMTKLIVSHSTNPFYNLAIEEWAVRNIDTSECDYLFMYVNTDCVVVGRNQNVFQEVNLSFCKENQIAVCRRVSGGGTVFHDLKNLNWTFITAFDEKKVSQYETFAQPILTVLKKIGITAYLNSRNAIMVEKHKISGQAQFTNRKNILSHGTLLIGSDTLKLEKSTKPENIKVNTKASPSVRSDVKNLEEIIQRKIELTEVIDLLKLECKITNELNINTLTTQAAIQKFQETYETKQWIFERSSKCTIEMEEIDLTIDQAIITSVINKKGEEILLHPYLNKSYVDLFFL